MMHMFELLNNKGEEIPIPYDLKCTLGNEVYCDALLLYQDMVRNERRYKIETDHESIGFKKDGLLVKKYEWHTWIQNHLGLVDLAHYLKEQDLTLIKYL